MLTLRPYQRSALNHCYDAWSTGQAEHPLIVAPCGAGKSIIIAALCHEALTSWPGTRILILTHRKELLRQDGAELQALWPEAPIGYYSAGLGKRDKAFPILFAGVQSIHRHITEFSPFDLVIIDEAHLIPRSASTMYGSCLAHLRLLDHSVKFVGLTATPYRLDSGRLDEGEGALFDRVVFDIELQGLVDAGHLVPMVAKGGEAEANLTGVHRRAGDFVASEVEAAFERPGLVERACTEIVERGQSRRAWLVFCSGVDHAEHVRDTLRERGVDAEMVTGKTPKDERDRLTARFRAGHLRCLCNVDILTTGANFPLCDLLVLLRATESTALYVQIVGRGMRVAPGKTNCLLLDFGSNVLRHGPIDRVSPKRPVRKGETEQRAPVKKCPVCSTYVHISSMECPDCGYVWPGREITHDDRPYEGAVMAAQQKPEWVEVTDVRYRRHQKAGKPDSVAVTYHCGPLTSATEWWCPEHGGYATGKTWACLQRAGMRAPRPETTSELLARLDELRQPAEIMITKEGKYTRVARVRYA